MKNFTETAKNVLHNTLMCLGCIAEMLRIKLFLSKDEKVVYALCNTVQEFLEESYSHLGYVKCSDEEVNQILYDYLNHYTSRKYGIKFLIPANQLREYDPRFKGKHFKGQQAIRKVWQEHGYLMDTHTAAGWVVAEAYVNQTGGKRPMVVLSTASPYKFPVAVLTAIGGDTSGSEFDQMERLSALSGVAIPGNLSGLQGKIERHTGVIYKEEMLEYVLSL